MLVSRLRWAPVWLCPAVATGQIAGPTCRAPDPAVRRAAETVAPARVQHRESRREIVIEIGPVHLPAGSADDENLPFVTRFARLPAGGWVHGYRLELVDGAGTPLPRRLLHHLELTRPGYPDLFLPTPQRLMMMGAGTEDRSVPAWMVGVPVRAGETLVLGLALRPVPHRSVENVTARLILPYTTRRPDVEVHGFRVDVMFPTASLSFDLPPGRSVWTWEGSPGFAGRVYALSGHLHRYAESLVLEDVTAGTVLYRARPSDPGGDAEVADLPVKLLRWGRGYVVRPTHRYRLTAAYVNPTGATIRGGGMAHVGGIYEALDPVPARTETGPPRGTEVRCPDPSANRRDAAWSGPGGP